MEVIKITYWWIWFIVLFFCIIIPQRNKFYLGLIKCVNIGGEMAPKKEVRPIYYDWAKNLFLEAKKRNIEIYFHQSGSMFIKDGKNIGKWNLKEQIKCAEDIQHELKECINSRL